MDPRDSFSPNRDPDRFDVDAAPDQEEPPPDGIRNAGTTQIMPGAEALRDAGDTDEPGTGSESPAETG